jgi:lipopolysaccharide/colanic/teichoic acid biosynthesis glycosyltransferase
LAQLEAVDQSGLFVMATAALNPPDLPATSAKHSTSAVDLGCRVLDVSVAAVALIVLMPLLVIIAIIIRFESPGSPLFRQRRLGRSLAPFTVHKFRTMRSGVSADIHRSFVLALIDGEEPAPAPGRPQFKLADDDRVTRVGRFLRRSSLDELPQLWDVLRGRMSLVGPRPALAYEVEHYPSTWFARFAVKPGMTGLWQVSGRSELTLAQMVHLDIEYAQRRSLWLNLQILLRTVPVVLRAHGAS